MSRMRMHSHVTRDMRLRRLKLWPTRTTRVTEQ